MLANADVQVVKTLVTNSVAQNAAIHCERVPPKTSFCCTLDAVYGLPIPVALEGASVVTVISKACVSRT